MRNILLISFFALALAACSKSGDSGGGGSTPAVETCKDPNRVGPDLNYSLPCLCKPGFTVSSDGKICEPNTSGGGGGGTGGGTISAPSISYSPNLRVAVVGTVMVALTPSTINCSAPAVCAFNLQGSVIPPSGINFDPNSGTFSGLANEVVSRLLTVRVANQTSSATTTVQINIVQPIPAGLAINGTSGTNYYSVGVTQILNITYSSAPGSVTGMTVSPPLPPGLTLQNYITGSNPQWRISGTPTGYSAKQTYTITATGPNTNGTATLNFQLGVLNPPSNYSYNLVASNPMSGGTGCVLDGSIPKCVFNKGQSFIATNPTITGDNLVYSVVSGGVAPIPSSELPAGILLSQATGVFATTNSGAYENTLQCSDGGAGYCLYVLRAANELGAVQTQIKIRINGDAPPTGFSYAGNNGAGKFLFREVTNVGNNGPVWVGNVFPSCQGQAGCYTISPVLPNGLNFSELSGRIQGSSDLGIVQALTNYTIMANNSAANGGALTYQIKIEIKERIPVFSYTQNATYTLEKAKDADATGAGAPAIINLSGGGGIPDGPLCGQLAIKVNSFSVSPALPPGLSLNTGSYTCSAAGGPSSTGGAITGTPTSVSENTTYTITGCNTGGCGTTTITLEVAPKITKIATGAKHACAIVQESMNEPYRVMCWGQNDKGQLGFTSTDTCSGVNCQLKAKYVRMSDNSILSGVEDVVAGANHTCVKMQSSSTQYAGGRVYCWGDNANGQLGNGTKVNSVIPVSAIRSTDNLVFKKVASLSAGGNQTCLSGEITTSYRNINGNDPDQYDFVGQVFCSDSVSGKMLKLSDPSETATGNQIFASKLIAVGDGHACAQAPTIAIVTNDALTGIGYTGYAGVKCWGSNDMGQLGGGTASSSSASPVLVPNSNIPAADISSETLQLVAGGKHSCYLKDVNTVKCWGSNDMGQLGRSTGSSLFSSSAAIVPMGSAGTNTLNAPAYLGSGAFSSLFGQNAPVSYVAGVNNTISTYVSGKLALSGAPYTGTASTSPISILDISYDGFFHGGNPISVGASTQDFACASGDNGGIRCWGKNDKGQLSIGNNIDSVTPVKLKFNLN